MIRRGQNLTHAPLLDVWARRKLIFSVEEDRKQPDDCTDVILCGRTNFYSFRHRPNL